MMCLSTFAFLFFFVFFLSLFFVRRIMSLYCQNEEWIFFNWLNGLKSNRNRKQLYISGYCTTLVHSYVRIITIEILSCSKHMLHNNGNKLLTFMLHITDVLLNLETQIWFVAIHDNSQINLKIKHFLVTNADWFFFFCFCLRFVVSHRTNNVNLEWKIQKNQKTKRTNR